MRHDDLSHPILSLIETSPETSCQSIIHIFIHDSEIVHGPFKEIWPYITTCSVRFWLKYAITFPLLRPSLFPLYLRSNPFLEPFPVLNPHTHHTLSLIWFLHEWFSLSRTIFYYSLINPLSPQLNDPLNFNLLLRPELRPTSSVIMSKNTYIKLRDFSVWPIKVY